MLTLGIDIGSATTKGVLLEDGAQIRATALRRAGIGSSASEDVLNTLLEDGTCTWPDIAAVVATGYGRKTLPQATSQMSELSCHARGAHFFAPEVRTLIDVGGQDAKVIRLDDRGRMLDFIMNDKCAAGTGRFMEVMSQVLGCSIDALSQLAEEDPEEAVPISSTCTVFAETEVISRLAAGASRGSVAKGVHRSVAKRVAGLARRCGLVPAVMMSGGVARNKSLVAELSQELNTPIIVSDDCQLCGALGAALYAWDKASGT